MDFRFAHGVAEVSDDVVVAPALDELRASRRTVASHVLSPSERAQARSRIRVNASASPVGTGRVRSPKLSGAVPRNRATRGTIAFRRSDRQGAPGLDDRYGDQTIAHSVPDPRCGVRSQLPRSERAITAGRDAGAEQRCISIVMVPNAGSRALQFSDLRDYDGPCFDGAAIVQLRREPDAARPGMRPALPSMTSGAPT